MNCDQALEEISAALDGELTDGARAELESHLASCPACRALYEELRGLQGALLESMEEPPADFHDRLMAAVAAEPLPVVKKAGRRRAWAGIAAAAAAAALVLLPQWGSMGGNSGGNGAAAPMMAAAPPGSDGPAAMGDEVAALSDEEAVPAEGRSMAEPVSPAGDAQEKISSSSGEGENGGNASNDVLPSSPPEPMAAMAPSFDTTDGNTDASGFRGTIVEVVGELPEGYAWGENDTLELEEEELPQLEAALEEAGISYRVEHREGDGIVLVIRLYAPGEQTAP